MSLYDYEKSREIYGADLPFYALIMAAMRGADTQNFQKLAMVFPATAIELEQRYNAPGGRLVGED